MFSLSWTRPSRVRPIRTFHLTHVQGLSQLLQQVCPGGVLLVLLAVVMLLGHARVVEPGVA